MAYGRMIIFARTVETGAAAAAAEAEAATSAFSFALHQEEENLKTTMISSKIAPTELSVEDAVNSHHHQHRRLGQASVDSQRRQQLQALLDVKRAAIANGLTPATTYNQDMDSIFRVETRQGGGGDQCFCEPTGNCGRTTSLGDGFSVTVTGMASNSIWIVTCEHPNLENPDCMYSPNNVPTIRIADDADLITEFISCSESCCNYVYPRYRDDRGTDWLDPRCTDTGCERIQRICFTGSTTFSCPVGTLMLVGTYIRLPPLALFKPLLTFVFNTY